MKIVILGAGIQGGIVAADLCDKELSPGEKEITVCDYDFTKAEKIAKEYGLKALKCDVRDEEMLVETLKGADMVINCVQYNWNMEIMKACLKVKAHYVDLGGLFHVTKEQFSFDEQFREAGLTAVLGMGSTPGTMNVMAGYAIDRLDTVETVEAICACADFTKTNAVFSIPYSLLTIMEEHTREPWILKDGKFTSVPPGSGREVINFSDPIGPATAFYCLHSEPALFAHSLKDKGIKNVSFKLSLPDVFEERVAFLANLGFGSDDPIEVDGVTVSPLKTMVNVVNRYLDNYDDSEDGPLNDCDVLRAVVKGKKDGVEKEYVVESVIRTSERWGFMAGALDTGIPLSILTQMVLKGEISERGVFSPDQCVPQLSYFEQLARREMPVYCVEKTPLSNETFKFLNDTMSKPK